jgi:hypothetical protein
MMPGAHVDGFLLPTWLAQQSPLKLLGILRAVKADRRGRSTDVVDSYPLDQVTTAVAAALAPGHVGR